MTVRIRNWQELDEACRSIGTTRERVLGRAVAAYIEEEDEGAPCLRGTSGCRYKTEDHDECEGY